jgi:hypothetical protein
MLGTAAWRRERGVVVGAHVLARHRVHALIISRTRHRGDAEKRRAWAGSTKTSSQWSVYVTLACRPSLPRILLETAAVRQQEKTQSSTGDVCRVHREALQLAGLRKHIYLLLQPAAQVTTGLQPRQPFQPHCPPQIYRYSQGTVSVPHCTRSLC